MPDDFRGLPPISSRLGVTPGLVAPGLDEPGIIAPPTLDETPSDDTGPPISSVPEPASMLATLAGLGLVAGAAYCRRRRPA